MVTVVETCPTLLVKGLVTEVMSKKGALSTCGGNHRDFVSLYGQFRNIATVAVGSPRTAKQFYRLVIRLRRNPRSNLWLRRLSVKCWRLLRRRNSFFKEHPRKDDPYWGQFDDMFD